MFSCLPGKIAKTIGTPSHHAAQVPELEVKLLSIAELRAALEAKAPGTGSGVRRTRGERSKLVKRLLSKPGVQYGHLSPAARQHLACLHWQGCLAAAGPAAATTGEATGANYVATGTATAAVTERAADELAGRHGQAEFKAEAQEEARLAAKHPAAAIHAAPVHMRAGARAQTPASEGSNFKVRGHRLMYLRLQ